MIRAIGVSTVVAAIALCQLTNSQRLQAGNCTLPNSPDFNAAAVVQQLQECYEEIASVYFSKMELNEQVAALALIFSVVFAFAVLIFQLVAPKKSSSPLSSSTPRRMPTTKSNYPYDALKRTVTDKDKFLCLYPSIRAHVLDHMKQENEMTEEATAWVHRMMDYTVTGGKHNRGIAVVAAYRVLQGRPLSQHDIAESSVLGWCLEIMQASFVVSDDVMDGSSARRGRPCWNKLEDVQLVAINDSFLLESMVFSILKHYFGQQPCYLPLVDLLLDVIQKTELGQLLESINQKKQRDNNQAGDLSRFTIHRYQLVAKYKTSFYSFYLPIAMAMCLSNLQSERAFGLVRDICCLMGEFFQAHTDFHACADSLRQSYMSYDDEGNRGVQQIQDNKCTWMIVQALGRCSSEQRKILEDNYGRKNKANVQKVMEVYRQLDLETIFETFEEDSYQEIQQLIGKVPGVPKEVFRVFLRKIYKRTQ